MKNLCASIKILKKVCIQSWSHCGNIFMEIHYLEFLESIQNKFKIYSCQFRSVCPFGKTFKKKNMCFFLLKFILWNF